MLSAALLLVAALGQRQTPALPPFPQPGAPTGKPAPSKPAQPSPSAAEAAPLETAPTEAQLGVPIYPGAQFLTSYDAGRGQRFYLFGSTASFANLVTYYRERLKVRGELVFDVPATHEFLVGRFREETMAFPPGVTVKDFESAISEGYPNPKPGGQPERFRTVIQIVPVVER
jgi:hypothetical protein